MAAILLLIVAVGVIFLTLDFPPPGQPDDPGAGTFPRIIAGLLGVLALLQLLATGHGEPLPRGRILMRIVGVVGLLVFYAVILEPLGFMAATVIFLVSSMMLAGVHRPLLLAMIPPGVSLALFYVFSVLLRISLPRGVVEGFIF